jgi:hypothetical protein
VKLPGPDGTEDLYGTRQIPTPDADWLPAGHNLETTSEIRMTVDRTHNLNHQTRYELRGDAGLAAVLTYTAAPDEPATWKILLPGPDGTEDLYGTRQIPTPDADWLRSWLTPIIGGHQSAELAAAVDAAPPPPAGWRHHGAQDD